MLLLQALISNSIQNSTAAVIVSAIVVLEGKCKINQFLYTLFS